MTVDAIEEAGKDGAEMLYQETELILALESALQAAKKLVETRRAFQAVKLAKLGVSDPFAKADKKRSERRSETWGGLVTGRGIGMRSGSAK